MADIYESTLGYLFGKKEFNEKLNKFIINSHLKRNILNTDKLNQ